MSSRTDSDARFFQIQQFNSFEKKKQAEMWPVKRFFIGLNVVRILI